MSWSNSNSAEVMNPNQSIRKVVVVGDHKVGKTSIIQQLIEHRFSLDTTTTIGSYTYVYHTKTTSGQPISMQIWDTAGQERFRSISKSYFRNAVGAILVYDITSMSSFEQLTDWLNDLQSLCVPNTYILLVGNKADLESQRQVGAQQVKEFAERHKLETIETSAMNGKNVKEAFTRLSMEISARVKSQEITLNQTPARPMQLTPEKEQKERRGCC